MAIPESKETIILPGREDYARILGVVDDEVTEHGGVRGYVGSIRTARRYSDGYNRFLHMSQEHAFHLLKEDDEQLLSSLGMEKARAILTGMVMGNVVNERLFPVIVHKKVYETVSVHPSLYAPGKSTEEIREEISTKQGQGRLYQVVAENAFTRLTDEDENRIGAWAQEAESDHSALFSLGAGVALFMAYDYHVKRHASLLLNQDGEGGSTGLSPQVDP